MRSPSLTFRLTLIFMLLIALICGAVSVSLYRSLRAELVWRDNMTLVNRAAQLRQLLQDGAEPRSLPLYFNRMLDPRQDVLLITYPDGRQMVSLNAAGIVLPELPVLAKEGQVDESVLRHWRNDEGRDVIALRLEGEAQNGPVNITVARVAQEREQVLKHYRRESLITCLLAVLLAGITSPLLIRRGLRAVRHLSRTTANTGSGTLQQPLALENLPRELLPLGKALNVMRQRLAEDFSRLTQFADDLAHELRTPVNILLGQNQVALSRERTIDEYEAVLAGNVEELERLTRLIENILFLARADHRNVCLQPEPVMLDDFLQEIADFLEPLAEEKALCFTLSACGTVQADRMLLQRAVTNLMTNAVRHAPEGSTVQLIAAVSDGQLSLSVTNEGEPVAEPNKLFTRFWRGDDARHSPGSGLGLSLVRAIASLHNGRVSYRHHAGSNCFTLYLPAA